MYLFDKACFPPEDKGDKEEKSATESFILAGKMFGIQEDFNNKRIYIALYTDLCSGLKGRRPFCLLNRSAEGGS